jgi:hypothetical protein
MPYGAVVITYALRIKVNEHVLIKCKSSKKTTKKGTDSVFHNVRKLHSNSFAAVFNFSN